MVLGYKSQVDEKILYDNTEVILDLVNKFNLARENNCSVEEIVANLSKFVIEFYQVGFCCGASKSNNSFLSEGVQKELLDYLNKVLNDANRIHEVFINEKFIGGLVDELGNLIFKYDFIGMNSYLELNECMMVVDDVCIDLGSVVGFVTKNAISYNNKIYILGARETVFDSTIGVVGNNYEKAFSESEFYICRSYQKDGSLIVSVISVSDLEQGIGTVIKYEIDGKIINFGVSDKVCVKRKQVFNFKNLGIKNEFMEFKTIDSRSIFDETQEAIEFDTRLGNIYLIHKGNEVNNYKRKVLDCFDCKKEE